MTMNKVHNINQILKENEYLIDRLRKEEVLVSYEQLLSVITNKILTIGDATLYFRDKYVEVPDWHHQNSADILKEAREAVKFSQERQWKAQVQRVMRRERKERLEIEKYMQQKGIGISRRLDRIRQLMEKCEREMNVCKDEEEYIDKRQKFKLMKKELQFLQNKDSQQEIECNNVDIENIVSQLKEEKPKNTNAPIPQKKLHFLFNHYSTKFSLNSIFEQETHSLNIRGFMQFAKDFKITESISPNQLYDLFKEYSQHTKVLSYENFTILVKSLPLQNTKNIFSHLNEKINQGMHLKKQSEYTFKIVPHTGKSKEEIEQEIAKKRVKFQEHIQQKYYAKNRKMSLEKISPQRAVMSPEKSLLRSPEKTGTKSLRVHTRKVSNPHLKYKPVEEEPTTNIFSLIPDDYDEYLKPLNLGHLPII